MDPAELYLPIDTPVLLPNGKMDPTWWHYFVSVAQGLGTIDLTSQVTGILPAANGGTGINNATRTLTLAGFGLSLTQTGATSLTTPTSGTLISTTGLQQVQVTTGSITAGTSALVTVTWPVSFGTTNYAAVASVLNSTAATASLSVVHIETQSATQIAVRVLNSAGGDLTGTLFAIGLHG